MAYAKMLEKEGDLLKIINNIEFHNESKEELLPDFVPDFPYIASYCEMNKYIRLFVPWHWHTAVELFYMESGAIEYYTPKGKMVFPKGSGGMVNSNVLHMTKLQSFHWIFQSPKIICVLYFLRLGAVKQSACKCFIIKRPDLLLGRVSPPFRYIVE